MDTSVSDEIFLFDDFFVPADDPGAEYNLDIRGRTIPIRVKRGLSLGDREASKAVATKSHINMTNGQIVVDGFDEGAFMIELLFRCIKSWPFTTKDGKAVPITRANLTQLRTESADAFAKLMNTLVGNAESKAEALAPFENPSGADFSPEAVVTLSSPSNPSASA